MELLRAETKDALLAGVMAERMADAMAAMWAVGLVASKVVLSVDSMGSS